MLPFNSTILSDTKEILIKLFQKCNKTITISYYFHHYLNFFSNFLVNFSKMDPFLFSRQKFNHPLLSNSLYLFIYSIQQIAQIIYA